MRYGNMFRVAKRDIRYASDISLTASDIRQRRAICLLRKRCGRISNPPHIPVILNEVKNLAMLTLHFLERTAFVGEGFPLPFKRIALTGVN